MESNRPNGFTVLEVMVATALITATAAGVASLFLASGRVIAESRTATIAELLAREKLEHLRAVPFDDPALTPVAADTLDADVAGYSDAPVAGYRRRWSIAALPIDPDSGVVLQVNVLHDGAVATRVVTIRSRKAN